MCCQVFPVGIFNPSNTRLLSSLLLPKVRYRQLSGGCHPHLTVLPVLSELRFHVPIHLSTFLERNQTPLF